MATAMIQTDSNNLEQVGCMYDTLQIEIAHCSVKCHLLYIYYILILYTGLHTGLYPVWGFTGARPRDIYISQTTHPLYCLSADVGKVNSSHGLSQDLFYFQSLSLD